MCAYGYVPCYFSIPIYMSVYVAQISKKFHFELKVIFLYIYLLFICVYTYRAYVNIFEVI